VVDCDEVSSQRDAVGDRLPFYLLTGGGAAANGGPEPFERTPLLACLTRTGFTLELPRPAECPPNHVLVLPQRCAQQRCPRLPYFLV